MKMHPIWSNMDAAGILPLMLDVLDTRDARAQLDANYAHGGGFRPFKGFELATPPTPDGSYGLRYPGDPVMPEVSRATLASETVVLFAYGWVAVIQPDQSFVVSRMD